MNLRDASETAIYLRLIAASKQREREAKGAEKPLTRFRVSRKTLLALCGRSNLPDWFLADLQEHLLAAGWSLFFAGQSYAMIRSDLVMGWVRLGSGRVEQELKEASEGAFDFAAQDRLLAAYESEQHRKGRRVAQEDGTGAGAEKSSESGAEDE